MKLNSVATIERAISGKIYPAGCSLIGLSATDGEIKILKEAGEVATKYAVVIPNKEIVRPKFLYRAMSMEANKFFNKYITTINLQFNTLEHFKVTVFDFDYQDYILYSESFIDYVIETEEAIHEKKKEFKKWLLEMMFI